MTTVTHRSFKFDLTQKWLFPVLILLAAALMIFGLGVFKVLIEVATNFKVIVYIVGGFIVLKLLKALGFKK